MGKEVYPHHADTRHAVPPQQFPVLWILGRNIMLYFKVHLHVSFSPQNCGIKFHAVDASILLVSL